MNVIPLPASLRAKLIVVTIHTRSRYEASLRRQVTRERKRLSIETNRTYGSAIIAIIKSSYHMKNVSSSVELMRALPSHRSPLRSNDSKHCTEIFHSKMMRRPFAGPFRSLAFCSRKNRNNSRQKVDAMREHKRAKSNGFVMIL